jgi:hypothetical protein
MSCVSDRAKIMCLKASLDTDDRLRISAEDGYLFLSSSEASVGREKGIASDRATSLILILPVRSNRKIFFILTCRSIFIANNVPTRVNTVFARSPPRIWSTPKSNRIGRSRGGLCSVSLKHYPEASLYKRSVDRPIAVICTS